MIDIRDRMRDRLVFDEDMVLGCGPNGPEIATVEGTVARIEYCYLCLLWEPKDNCTIKRCAC